MVSVMYDFTMQDQSPKAKRLAAGRSQLSVAAEAGVSLPTLRLYETDRSVLSADKRRALDVVYARLRPAKGAA